MTNVFAAEARPRNFPYDWWAEVSKQPDGWYATAEGRKQAENILSWQDTSGGWPLMATINEPWTGDESAVGPWGRRGALIKATVNEMRFLTRGYRVTKDERYRQATLAALDFILKAQYPAGGWPHSYPNVRNPYDKYITFNDDEMTDLMRLLREVASARDFEWMAADKREAARLAFDRGVGFLLNSQIFAGGKPTAWAQQYDEVTLQPRAARKFEPVALSGGESAGVLLLLMSIEKPSPEVVRAIEAGVAWYDAVKIEGIRVDRSRDDRVVVADAKAPPIWARYYEIGTNKPIFAGRDGVIKDQLAEIEQERRGGYNWYDYWGKDVLARYATWKRTAPRLTNIDEARVGTYRLPDPLVMLDGGPVRDAKAWVERRRPEILKLFEEHQHGRTPQKKLQAKYDVWDTETPALGGKAKRTQVRIRFSDDPATPTLRVLLYTPAKAQGPVPTLLHLSFSPNVLVVDDPGIEAGFGWNAQTKQRVPGREARKIGNFYPETFLDRGFGVALVYYGDIDPDFDGGARHGVRSLFGDVTKARGSTEWGTIGGWSWGVSRVLDYLQTNPGVDGKRVALSGVSRLGKAVLWAAALDERFALVMPLVSGEGGAALSRRNFGETVADLTNPKRYHYWYAPKYADYAQSVAALPVDGHLLISLIAPRPLLLLTGSADHWSDPKGEFAAAVAAEPVYELFGKQGLGTKQWPQAETPIFRDIGYFMQDGPHEPRPHMYTMMAQFMAQHLGTGDAPVTVTEDADTYTLSNGVISARVLKDRGDLVSLVYRGTETLTGGSGHAFAYWSHDTRGGADLKTRISIDPRSNDGVRGEVSIKAISGGRRMGHGPGAPQGGDFPADIEIRYTLARGDSALYTYAIFNHLPEHDQGSMVEARYAAKLDPFFDYIHVDARRHGVFPLYGEGEDKYIYTALQSEHRAFGWSSTSRKIGWFMLNPSVEFLSGGPTKPEFLAHGPSTVLNYWRSSHYGGANVPVAKGEAWTKVIGPFALYVNEGETPQAMWDDAKSRLQKEQQQWPYAWVNAPEYVQRGARAEVRGELVLTDPIEPSANQFKGAVHVGLTKAAFEGSTERGPRTITWQRNAKDYQFWTRQDRSGAFIIPNVIAGDYTLYAFADGVLGEYSQANVRVEAGKRLDLGKITWQPVRRGRQLWEIGTADRTALEFTHASRFYEPGTQLRYVEQFPNDVSFTIGKSKPAQDWFFAHVPHNIDPNAHVWLFRGVKGEGRATPYTIRFNGDGRLKGRATLRLAICGSGAKQLDVAVNGKPAGQVELGSDDGVITRHQIQGLWYERELAFDASMLKRGENTLTLTIPAGGLNAGVIYDYLRLEVDDGVPSSAAAQAEKPQLFPANHAINVNPDTQLALQFDTPPTIGTSGLIRIYDAGDNSLVDTLDMSIPSSPRPTGRAPKSTEAERQALAAATKASDYQLNTVGGVDFHFFPIIVRGSKATIYPHNNKLKYGRTYRVQIDRGVLKTAGGEFAGFGKDGEWTFTTKAGPPPVDAERVVVSADGRGDFNTVQGAIDFAPVEPSRRLTIFIRNGNYEELVFLNGKNNLTIRGEDRAGVQVGYPNNSAFNPSRGGPSRRPAFSIQDAAGIQLSTFTINNYFIGQAEALLVRGEQIVIDQMDLNGSGDALTTYGTLYMVDSKLTGHGDTILAYAALYCLRCEVRSSGPFTWTRTPPGSHGNVFVDSTFIAVDEPLPWTVNPDGTGGQKVSKVLARLPRNGPAASSYANFPHAEMVLINARMDGVPAEGWGPIEAAPGFDSSNVKFWEFNTTDLDGRSVDVSQRHPVSKQLILPRDADALANYRRPEFVLKGWRPHVH